VSPTWFSLFGVLTILFGGFNPSDKYENQLGLFSIYGKNVPNHQPASDCQGKAKCVVYTSQISLLLVLPHYQKWRVNHHKVDFPANI
jgi:hypothetical protein